VTEVLYIDLDTASQITWGNDDSVSNQGRCVFIQVVHAIPQNSLYPHISVRVWAKQVEDDDIPALLVLQRKHVLYDSALGGASRVDRVVFGLQIPNPGFKMTTHKKVLLGTCMHSRCVCYCSRVRMFLHTPHIELKLTWRTYTRVCASHTQAGQHSALHFRHGNGLCVSLGAPGLRRVLSETAHWPVPPHSRTH